MTQAEREALVADALKTEEGRRKLAEAVAQPLRGIRPSAPRPACGLLVREAAVHAGGRSDAAHQVLGFMGS